MLKISSKSAAVIKSVSAHYYICVRLPPRTPSIRSNLDKVDRQNWKQFIGLRTKLVRDQNPGSNVLLLVHPKLVLCILLHSALQQGSVFSVSPYQSLSL